MTYVTEVKLDHRLVCEQGVRDSYGWHKLVWKFFPGRAEASRDYLTRLEEKQGIARLLILSQSCPTRPDWLPEQCWLPPKLVPESFLSHSHYHFRLSANPTKKVKAFNPDGTERRNGRRQPLTARGDLEAWIKRKGEQAGFEVDPNSLRTYPRSVEYFEKRGQGGLHSVFEFEGVLAVTDREKFQASFHRGIGSAKAFGFGMLVIRPL